MQLASGTVKPVTLELGGKSANIVLDDADLDQAAGGGAVGHVLARRPGVRVGHPGARAEGHLRRVREPARRQGRQDRDRRPDRHGHRPRAARVARPGRDGRALREARSRRGRRADQPVAASPTAWPRTSTATRSSSRRSSPTSTTRPRSPRRRSSARCCASSRSTPTTRPSPSPTTRSTAWPAACRASNLERAEAVAGQMRTGTVWINDYHLISPERPFGGYKQSGIGRELGTQGYDVYRQVKHVHINPEIGRSRQPLPLRAVGRLTAHELFRNADGMDRSPSRLAFRSSSSGVVDVVVEPWRAIRPSRGRTRFM